MKKIIIFATCVFIWTSYAQLPVNPAVDLNNYEVLDSVKIKFTYKMLHIFDNQKPDSELTDMQILEIGNKISKYYSRYLTVDYPEFLKAYPGTSEGVPNNPERGTQPYEIYKDYPAKGTQTVTDISNFTLNRTLYLYEESIPIFDWILYDEFTTVLDYRCQKATVSFRGRDYTAWFTSEIPISNGPWKFGGLPGLIMKVMDSENCYDFECVGIEKKNEVIKLHKGHYNKIKRKDYLKLYERMHKDIAVFLESLGIRVHIEGVDSVPSMPYNPIELE